MPQREPYITVRAVQPVVAALDALGHDTAVMLEEVDLLPDVLNDPEGRVPHGTMMALWAIALEATGDDHLGLHLAQTAPVEAFEVHAYAVLSSPTLREAYRRAVRYQRLIHEVTDLVFEEGPEEGILCHALPSGRAVPRHPAEFLVTLWVRFGRLVTDDNWAPATVYFSHEAPTDCTEHERTFRTPVVFASGQTALHVPNRILNLPNPRADVGLLDVLDRYAEEHLRTAPQRPTLAERVRVLVEDTITSGAPTAESVADALHMSVRTLHRNLRDEGTKYLDILDGVRHKKATRLLDNPRCSIAEVAFLLGFAEVSSFYRAFKRWTGTTPANFREDLSERSDS